VSPAAFQHHSVYTDAALLASPRTPPTNQEHERDRGGGNRAPNEQRRSWLSGRGVYRCIDPLIKLGGHNGLLDGSPLKFSRSLKGDLEALTLDHDNHMQEREAEKIADLECLADAFAAFRQLHRALDQWERVHLARGLAAVWSGCYGTGAIEAELALMPEIERSPRAKLPTDPSYEQLDLDVFERALNEMWAEPARRFPHFGKLAP
jgi:hypothetical protein